MSDEHDVDIEADVSDLSLFLDNSVSELYCSQILEHFPHPQTESVLKEWHRVLKPGAKITIGVPDFDRVVELYHQIGLCGWVMNFVCGDQLYPLAFHYRIFTFATLAALLNKVGFKNIKRISNMPYGIVDCSALKSTIDGKCVSLNVETYK